MPPATAPGRGEGEAPPWWCRAGGHDTTGMRPMTHVGSVATVADAGQDSLDPSCDVFTSWRKDATPGKVHTAVRTAKEGP